MNVRPQQTKWKRKKMDMKEDGLLTCEEVWKCFMLLAWPYDSAESGIQISRSLSILLRELCPASAVTRALRSNSRHQANMNRMNYKLC